MGIELDVGEVQTTADAAVETLRGRRVLALDGMDHMHARYEIAVTATYRGSDHGG